MGSEPPPPPPGPPEPGTGGGLPPPPPTWSPSAAQPTVRYASFGRRVAASLIDAIVVIALYLSVNFAVGFFAAVGTNGEITEDNLNSLRVLASVVSALVILAYYTFFWSNEGGGRTVGNRMLRVQVLRSSGELVSAPRALFRALFMYVSILTFFLGLLISFVTVLATPRKQALHDLLCDTVVVRDKRPG